MKLTSAIQESLVALICHSTDVRVARSVLGMVPVGSFDPFYKELATSAEAYINRFKCAPGEHTIDLIEELKQRFPKKAETYDDVSESIALTSEGINEEYVMAQAREFARYQRFRRSAVNILDELEVGTAEALDRAESLFGNALKSVADITHIGTRLWKPEEALHFMEVEDVYFPTGIPELDKYDLGPARKQLHLSIGASNIGKSWWFTQLGKINMMHGHKILHVTLEMSEEEVAKRYMMALFSISKRKGDVDVTRFLCDELGRFQDFDFDTVEDRPSFQDDNIRSYIRNKLTKMGRRCNLVVKAFPTGSLTASALESYMDMLETREAFIPDLVVLDYPDLMEVKGEYRHALDALYKGLRGLAVSRNIGMSVVTQGNRESFKKKVVDSTNVAEDIRKIATADAVLTFNRTRMESQLGLARIFAAKARGDKKEFEVLLSQSFELGQFCVDSARMSGSSYWEAVKLEAGEEDD